ANHGDTTRRTSHFGGQARIRLCQSSS
ncbi:GMP synthase [glutamine-hydrolyzing], amidotransferase subunit (EC 6.3.5.2) / GMP synthase [glutamine-hydrolyzing], ATP pyrophosphatase subunit (EC 6.3.5.2), partial [uncultured Gammaproteobacteria bacterium]